MLLGKIIKILLSERIKISKFKSSLTTLQNNFSSSDFQYIVNRLLKSIPMINQRQLSKILYGNDTFIALVKKGLITMKNFRRYKKEGLSLFIDSKGLAGKTSLTGSF